MAEQANHHFVPKFYFRNFSEDRAHIHLLHRSSGRIIPNVPIEGQCAKHRFYGPIEMERRISVLEGAFSSVIRDAIHSAWDPQNSRMTRESAVALREATLFQKVRTAHEVDKFSSITDPWILTSFKEYLRSAPDIDDRERMVKDIEDGNIRLRQNDTWLVNMLLIAACDAAPLISDLPIWLIRNHTDFPFLFGDAPVVLYNGYYRNITLRGVLGLQTPGLQIFFPLNSRTLLLMMDDEVYAGRCKGTNIVDVTDRSDVSQLNALQLHHSLASVYFGHEDDAEYVGDLWRAHKTNVVQSRTVFKVEEDWRLDGKPVDKLFHNFEPHLNLRLDLSFIECNPIRESDYEFSRRTPELAEEYDRISRMRASV